MNKKEIKTYATAAIIIALICVVYKMYFPQEGMKVNGKTIQGMKDLDSLKGMKDLDSLKGMKDLDKLSRSFIPLAVRRPLSPSIVMRITAASAFARGRRNERCHRRITAQKERLKGESVCK